GGAVSELWASGGSGRLSQSIAPSGRSDGTWRSPVAHLNGVQGVAGSNPAVPTRPRPKRPGALSCRRSFFPRRFACGSRQSGQIPPSRLAPGPNGRGLCRAAGIFSLVASPAARDSRVKSRRPDSPPALTAGGFVVPLGFFPSSLRLRLATVGSNPAVPTRPRPKRPGALLCRRDFFPRRFAYGSRQSGQIPPTRPRPKRPGALSCRRDFFPRRFAYGSRQSGQIPPDSPSALTAGGFVVPPGFFP